MSKVNHLHFTSKQLVNRVAGCSPFSVEVPVPNTNPVNPSPESNHE